MIELIIGIAVLSVLLVLWKLVIKPLIKFSLMAIVVIIALILFAKFFNLFETV